MPSLIYIQSVNWRTVQVQFLDENGDPIDLTGATGVLVYSDSENPPNSYETEAILGRWDAPSDQAADAILGYVYGIEAEISASGAFSEQFQLVLPSNSEPLYGGVVTFSVNENLDPPTP